jgi:hypothetical protein
VIIGLDHGPKTCIFKITNKRGSPNNGYGFQFRGLLLDMMAGTQYGVYAENTSFIHIDDCSAFSATSTSLPQWLACGRITDAPGFSGEDCSWWRITNCHANQVGLVTNGTAGRSGGLNQWFMGWNVCFPGNQVHACISLIGNDRPTTLSNNLEPGNAGHKVYALYLDHVGRGTFIGDSGECTVPSTFLKAMSCSGCLFAPTGYLAPASTSRLVDDDHGANIVLAPTLTAAGQNYSNSPNIHLPAGTSPRSGFSPEGLLGMEVASMPNPLSRGGWSLGYELIDVGVAGNTVKAEFLDGKVWKPWAPAALANISYPNTDVLVIDEAHKTCRFLIGTTGDRDWPLLLCRFWANAGSPHGTIQCTVELLGADLTSVAATAHFPLLLDPGSTEGFTFPVGYTDGSYVRVTLAFPLARGQSVAFGRLALYTSSLGRTKDAPGQHFKGTGSPEGRVRGNPGDIYVNIAGGAGKTLYIKESGNSNNTGWRAV